MKWQIYLNQPEKENGKKDESVAFANVVPSNDETLDLDIDKTEKRVHQLKDGDTVKEKVLDKRISLTDMFPKIKEMFFDMVRDFEHETKFDVSDLTAVQARVSKNGRNYLLFAVSRVATMEDAIGLYSDELE